VFADAFSWVSGAASMCRSALIIGAGESGSTLVGKVLSWRPIVFVGLISYSLYLWHWPVIILNDLGLSVNFIEFLPHHGGFPRPLQKSNDIVEVLAWFVLATLGLGVRRASLPRASAAN
jgi:hypothetical protein